MATQEQIEYVFSHLRPLPPDNFFKSLQKGSAGINAVLRILDKAHGNVTAGDISDFMHISTARVAAILKNMSAKGLIIKTADVNDARITIVSLSPTGRETVQKMKEDMYSRINTVIDKVGMERMYEFIDIAEEIKAALPPPNTNL